MEMKKYDLILVETAHYKKPHYEKIQRQIAELLTEGGLRVAVINFKRNNDYHNNRIYDVINIHPDLPDPPVIWRDRKGRNKLERLRSIHLLSKEEKRYFEVLFDKIKHLSDAIYWGTISSSTLNLLKIKALRNKKIFLWEGAYYAFLFTNFKKIKSPIAFFKPILLSKFIKKNDIKILVANEPIHNVLVKKGFEDINIIIRPEETFKESGRNITKLNNKFCLTTIGAIRHEKNIHFALNALENKKIKYIVAGKSNNQYAYDIDERMKNMDKEYFVRLNQWFTDEEYHDLIKQSHFLIICDIEFPCPGSNGTLFDAVKNVRPVIVPDHTHFRYYIDKYKIGLKYEPDNKNSFLSAVDKAKELGNSYFYNKLIEMRNDFKHDKIVKDFTNNVRLHLQ